MDAEAQSNPSRSAHVAARLMLQASVTLTESELNSPNSTQNIKLFAETCNTISVTKRLQSSIKLRNCIFDRHGRLKLNKAMLNI